MVLLNSEQSNVRMMTLIMCKLTKWSILYFKFESIKLCPQMVDHWRQQIER